MGMDVRLLGAFGVAIDGEVLGPGRWERRQAATVVKLLALAPAHRLHQEQVMEVLWPGADPATAQNGLHKMVHMARHAFEPSLRAGHDSRYLVRSEGLLQLVAPGGVVIDADVFEHEAVAALRERDEGKCAAALLRYEGDLLPTDRFAEWASVRRERLRLLRLELLATLAACRADRGELVEATRTVQQWLEFDATNEVAHRLLMELFMRAGQRAQALRQFEHCRAVLQRELETVPERATRALQERILAGQDEAVMAASAKSGRPEPPSAVPAPATAIAVLPFMNLTGDPRREFLASGLSDSVIRALCRQPALRVLAPSTVGRYRGREIDPVVVGRELGVGTMLLGRIDSARPGLGVSVELVRAADGTLLWGERFEGTPALLPAIEAQIAMAIASRLLPGVAAVGSGPATQSPKAHEQYLRGRYAASLRTAAALTDAARHFEQAIAADPKYALALSGLADCHALSPLYAGADPTTAMPSARAAAQRALELDPNLAEAHTSLGYVQFAFEWDFGAAEASFRQAIALAPNYATAHQWLHELLCSRGRVAEQKAAVARAHALDPLSPLLATEIGWGLYFAGDAAAACEQLERVVAQTPMFPIAWTILGLAQLLIGETEAAAQATGHALQVAGDAVGPFLLGAHGYALAQGGDPAGARAIGKRLGGKRPAGPAAAHAAALVQAGLGNHGEAMALLGTALQGRADRLVYLGVEPMFATLRPLPSFQQLLQAIGPAPAAPTVVAGATGKIPGRGRQAPAQGRGRTRR